MIQKAVVTLEPRDPRGSFVSSRQLVEFATRALHNPWSLLDFLLSPLPAVAYAFAFWRLSADIGWSASFFIHTGLFSHWIPWFSVGLALGLRRRVFDRLDSRQADEISAIDERPQMERRRQLAVNQRKQRRPAEAKVGYASALLMVQPKRGLNLDDHDQPADRQRKIPA